MNIHWLSSLKLTLGAIICLLLAVIIAHGLGLDYAKTIALPVIVLTLNLMAAIVYQAAFRRDISLLIFHLALAMLLPVALYGSLAGFTARFELPEGADFSHELLTVTERGFLHPYSLERLSLRLLVMDASYIPGKRAQRVRARVLVDGEERVIAEHLPLIWNEYRLYVTKNIGFSGHFVFSSDQGQSLYGVNFPWLAGNELRQANEIDAFGEPFWLKLEGVETLLQTEMQSVDFVPPADAYVVFRQDGRRVALRPGERVAVNGGSLLFVGIGGWQGFEIIYDPAKRLLLAIGLILCLAMGWYFYRRFGRYDWETKPPQG
jgi:hypothetical protein